MYLAILLSTFCCAAVLPRTLATEAIPSFHRRPVLEAFEGKPIVVSNVNASFHWTVDRQVGTLRMYDNPREYYSSIQAVRAFVNSTSDYFFRLLDSQYLCVDSTSGNIKAFLPENIVDQPPIADGVEVLNEQCIFSVEKSRVVTHGTRDTQNVYSIRSKSSGKYLESASDRKIYVKAGTDARFVSEWIVNHEKDLIVPDVLQDFENQGVVLFTNEQEPQFMRIADKTHRGLSMLSSEPVEYYSRLSLAQVPHSENEYYIRLGDFQYVCEIPNGFLKAFQPERVKDMHVDNSSKQPWEIQEVSRKQCVFAFERLKESPKSKISNVEYLYSIRTANGRYVERLNAFGRALTFSPTPGLGEWYIKKEVDVVPNLGLLEGFITTDRKYAFLRSAKSGKFVDSPHADPGPDLFQIVHDLVEEAEDYYFYFERKNRISNAFYIKNVKHGSDKYACKGSGNRLTMMRLDQTSIANCEFIGMRGGEGNPSEIPQISDGPTVIFQHVKSGLFVGNAGLVLVDRHSPAAAGQFSLVPASPSSTFELLDVKIDESVSNTLTFIPDEVKTVSFINDSPVDQQQVIDMSDEKTISMTTSWSTAFSIDTTFESSFKFFGSKVGFSLSIGFSAEYGREYSREKTISTSNSKTFTIPACTEMHIMIGQSATTGKSIPFVATFRENKADGTSQMVHVPGVQSGIVFDQTLVNVDSKPIDGCTPNDSTEEETADETRRHLRG